MRDITTPESPANNHSESVGIKVLDVGRRFDDAASDNAGLPPHQLGRRERVGEDVVVQTRDATEPIKRDRTNFVARVSPRRMQNRSGYLLSLGGLTPARTRTEHLDDGVGSDGGKPVCDGTDGELFHSLLDLLHPNHIVFLCRDTDVGVLVEHLVDRDQVFVPIVMTVITQNVSPMRYDAVETMRTRSSRRRDQGDPEPCPRDGPRSPWRPWRSRCSRGSSPSASERECFPLLLSVR